MPETSAVHRAMTPRSRRLSVEGCCLCGMARPLRWGIMPLMQLAEDAGERDRKNLLAELVGGIQHPAAPVFRAGRHDVGADDPMRVLAGLDKVVDGDAALGGELVFLVGAMEIDVRHVRYPGKRI